MEKYVFTKKVSMGFIKRNAEPGQTVEFGENYAMFQNEKITDLRDFEILKKHKIIIPATQVVADQLVQKKVEQPQNKFGFTVKKETEQTNVIPLTKFVKATEIDQSKAFVQEDGIIKQEQSKQVHVAKVEEKVQQKEQLEKQEQKKEQNVEQQKVQKNEKVQNKTATKKSTTTTKKNTKSAKKEQTTTVRGMKVIKED